MTDTTHLVALMTRLSHERDYLSRAKSAQEISLRSIWISQIEKEIADEERFLGIEPAPEMTDEEILAELFA